MKAEPQRPSKRSMLNCQPLSCDDLREMLTDKKDVGTSILILDCRSFLAFNECHISSAVNAYCPSILRRRSRGKLPFHVLIPSKDTREKLLRGFYTAVVLYEECPPTSPSFNTGSPTTAPAVTCARDSGSDDISSFRVVGRSLQQDGLIRNLYYLEGGFLRFRQKYPHLCVHSLHKSPTTALSSWDPQVNHHNPVYEQGDPVEILPYVYLGSAFHAANQRTLDRLKITALLNVSRNCPNPSELGNLHYKCIPVEDSGNADISSWFHEAIEYIDEVKSSGGKVLVHCHAGISRSATICLAYLMTTKRIRLEEAYEYVKKRRSVISPNLNFMGQLLKYESQLGLFSPTLTSRANSAVNNRGGGGSSGSSSSSSTSSTSSTSSPLHTFAAAMAAAAAANSKENCLRSAQRFVFDLNTNEDNYTVSSPTAILSSPMCATPS
ncbi:Dual specificity protein phosphatase 4 [Chamberlinius hualienensis]